MIPLQTWCHCGPAQTPSSLRTSTPIHVEEDNHCVASSCYGLWLEVLFVWSWFWGGAAALLHQDCPVPIGDLDKVVLTVGSPFNFKAGELKPHYLPTIHFQCVCPITIRRVAARVVWWGDNTCDKRNIFVNFIQECTPRPVPELETLDLDLEL